MSDVLQGARTKDYVKEDINGIENSGDKLRYVTLQDVQGKRAAMDVLIHGVTVVSSGHAVEGGSARRLIKSTASGAKVGWFMRPTSGNSAGEEIPIIRIVDADTFVIAALFDMAISDTFELVKPVTPNYTASGDLNVVVNGSGPIEYELDGITTVVSQDTVTPSNSNPLPANLFIQKNGQNLPVSKDTVTPSNTNPVPVEIVSGSGTEINITAGDIDIHTSSEGTNFDSIRLGDGSGIYVGVTPSGEAKVFDANANTSLGQIATDTLSINLKTPALVGGNVPVDTGLVQGLTDIQLRATPVPVSGTVTAISQAQTSTFVEDQTISTAPETFSAPVGAFAALIEADDTNSVNIRVVMGGVSSSTSGIQFQPGRSELYQGGSNISYCAESGSGQKISVQWFIRT